jgi:malonate decarboxylase epsilon subunit
VSVAFLYPGQGTQQPDMLDRLPDHRVVATTLNEASQVLGDDVRLLDSPQALQATRAVQLCLLVSGVACSRLLVAQGAVPDLTLGLSIGAYAAAVTAGVLDFADALRLVSLRGHLMETAFPRGYGMAALIGLDLARVEDLVGQAATADQPLFVANINSPDQIVVAGHEGALTRVIALAMRARARRAERVAISVPSHCPLLDDAAVRLSEAFKGVVLQRSAIGYLSANAARLIADPAKIADDLAHNMARQVHWHDSATLAYERGMRLAVEMAPGSVLTSLTRGVMNHGGDCLALVDARIDTIVALCRRQHEE